MPGWNSRGGYRYGLPSWPDKVRRQKQDALLLHSVNRFWSGVGSAEQCKAYLLPADVRRCGLGEFRWA